VISPFIRFPLISLVAASHAIWRVAADILSCCPKHGIERNLEP
jgi:hypothetical protein